MRKKNQKPAVKDNKISKKHRFFRKVGKWHDRKSNQYLLRVNSVQNFGLELAGGGRAVGNRSARADCLRLRDSVPLPHFSLSLFSDRFSPLIGYRQVRTRTETPPRSRPHFENCWTDRLSSHWICALSLILFHSGEKLWENVKLNFQTHWFDEILFNSHHCMNR